MRRIGSLLALVVGLFMVVGAGSPLPEPSVANPVDGVTALVIQLRGAEGGPLAPGEQAAAEAVVAARLAALPAPGSTVTSIPDDRLRVDIVDAAQAESVRRLATAPGVLRFVPVPNAYAATVQEGQPLPEGMAGDPLFANDGIASVSAGSDSLDKPALDIQLTAEAGEVFDEYAAAHQGERFAMVLDGVVESAPTINATDFNGRAQISGGFDEPAVAELVAILSGGVLPVRAEVLESCPAAPACPVPSVLPVPSGPA